MAGLGRVLSLQNGVVRHAASGLNKFARVPTVNSRQDALEPYGDSMPLLITASCFAIALGAVRPDCRIPAAGRTSALASRRQQQAPVIYVVDQRMRLRDASDPALRLLLLHSGVSLLPAPLQLGKQNRATLFRSQSLIDCTTTSACPGRQHLQAFQQTTNLSDIHAMSFTGTIVTSLYTDINLPSFRSVTAVRMQ